MRAWLQIQHCSNAVIDGGHEGAGQLAGAL